MVMKNRQNLKNKVSGCLTGGEFVWGFSQEMMRLVLGKPYTYHLVLIEVNNKFPKV